MNPGLFETKKFKKMKVRKSKKDSPRIEPTALGIPVQHLTAALSEIQRRAFEIVNISNSIAFKFILALVMFCNPDNFLRS